MTLLKEDVRTRILSASLELMSEGGLAALSMREVARRAGVSHQAPYHHFADREAILAEHVKIGFGTLRDYETEAIEKTDDLIERVAAVGAAYINFALDHPALFQLMFRREMVEMDRHEEAACAADQAFDIPLQVVAAAHGKTPDEALPEMLACWSSAHGLATLLLEGKLDRHFPATREARDACVEQMMQFQIKNLRASIGE